MHIRAAFLRVLSAVFLAFCLPLIAVAETPVASLKHLRLIGDSTMADKPTEPPNPEHGWGQMLPIFFREPAQVVNYAVNGRSTKSFIDEGRWDKVLSGLQPGDFVVIEFGHNDEKKEDPKRYADPHGAYRDNLRRFIQETRARHAIPILATPVVRRKFDAQGKLVDTHGDYPEAVRVVAREEKVPLLELERLTAKLEQAAGPDESKKLHLWVPAGAYTRKPEGWQDDTHFSAEGATKVAGLAVDEFRRLDLPLVGWLK